MQNYRFRNVFAFALSTIRKPMIILVGSTALSQLLLLAVTPVITRLYSPNEYGNFALVFALGSILSLLVVFRYDTAIPVADSDRKAFHLAQAALILAFASSILLLILIAILNLTVSPLHSLSFWREVWYVPLYAFLLACFMTLAQLNLRFQAFGAISSRSFLQAILSSIIQILLSFSKFAPSGLIVGDLAGRTLSLATLIRAPVAFRTAIEFRFRRSWQVARVYWDFPTRGMPAALVDASTTALPLVAAGILFGSGGAGVLALASRIAAVPVALLGASAAQVLTARLSDVGYQSEARMQSTLKGTLVRLVPIGILVTVALIFGSLFFEKLFGSQWTGGGTVLAACALASGTSLVWIPASQIFVFRRSLASLLRLNLTRLFALIAVFFVCYSAGSSLFQFCFAIYSTIAIVDIVGICFAIRLSRRSAQR